MKKTNRENEHRTGFFAALRRKISDKIYDIKVAIAAKKPQKPQNSSAKAGKIRRQAFYWALIALPVVQYLIFYVGVNFNSVLLAFRSYKVVDGVETFEWAGFAQFKLIWQNFTQGVILKQMLGNSVTFYLFGLLVTMPIALVFSFYIYKKCMFSEFFRVILFLPSVISAVVTVFMYQFTVDVAVVEILNKFGTQIAPPLGQPKLKLPLVILYNFLMGFGTNVCMYSSAMTRIPVSIVEYAQIDGVKPLREFFSITLPLIFDTISTFVTVGIAGIFTNQANLYAMYSNLAGMEVQTLGYHLFILTSMGNTQVNFPYAAALGLVFTIIVYPLTMLVRKLLDRIDPKVQY